MRVWPLFDVVTRTRVRRVAVWLWMRAALASRDVLKVRSELQAMPLCRESPQFHRFARAANEQSYACAVLRDKQRDPLRIELMRALAPAIYRLDDEDIVLQGHEFAIHGMPRINEEAAPDRASVHETQQRKRKRSRSMHAWSKQSRPE